MGKISEIANDFWHNFQDVKNTVESHTGILTGIGIVTALAGTVLACRATVKVARKIEEHNKKVDEVKTKCAEEGKTPEETQIEVKKTYKHVGFEYAKQFLPAVGLLTLGYGIIVRAHVIEVAKNEALMSAYVALQGFFAKYRAKVASTIGEEHEAELYNTAKSEVAQQLTSEYNGPFTEGSYIIYNDSCADYTEGCPQANSFVIDTVERELNIKYNTLKRVYVNDVMRALGHETIKDGWKWCWYKPLTPEINFHLHDVYYNPEYAKGYGFESADGKEILAKLYLMGCVHVDETYRADVRRNNLADGGVIGGRLGMDPVIIG